MSVRVPTKAELQPNPNKGRRVDEHIAEYGTTGAGLFQGLRLGDRITQLYCAIVRLFGRTPSTTAVDCQAKFFTGWAAMGVVKLFGMTRDSIRTILDVRKKSLVPQSQPRKIEKAVRDTTETLGLWGHVIGFFGRTKVLAPAASTLDLISDSFDLKIAATDLARVNAVSKQAASTTTDPEVVQNIKHTRCHTMIRIAKAVCAVVGGIFGVSLLLLGGPVIPAIILVTFALASTIFSVTGHFYKETRQHKILDFFDHKRLYNIPAAAAS